MAPLFIETSALLHVVLRQERAPEVRARMREASRIIGSRLLVIEMERALLRIGLDNPGTELLTHRLEGELRSFWSRVDLFHITDSVCRLAGQVAPRSRLRTLDAIHVATFLEAKKKIPDLGLLTFDTRIAAALNRG